MDEGTFKDRMHQARLIGGDYASGYQRGLRRLYHGEQFGTPQEHEILAAPATPDDDATRTEIKRGYRDGLEGRAPDWGEGRS
jgi:hypothetical protein